MKQIALTQGKVALVDDADFEWLTQWKWYTRKEKNTYYAVRTIITSLIKSSSNPNRKRILLPMHRDIMNAPKGKDTDHINHNGLDNRRCNLRICSRSENNQNQLARKCSSIYKGVSWSKAAQKWEAYIKKTRKRIYLGYHINEVDAALAYDIAAKKLFGEFAHTNLGGIK